MNKLRIILFFLAAAVIGAMYLISQPFATVTPKVVVEKKFSDDNLVAIQLDSFKNLVQQVYGANATVTSGKNIEINIANQGTRYPYFYNNNERLLKVVDQGFEIKYDVNKSILQSSFKKENKNGINYIWLPSDVVMGIVQQKNN